MNYIERRQTSVSSRIIPVQPFDYVVFGATGDLTKRKLIPALYHRFHDGQFDEESRIIGVSRSTLSPQRTSARFSPLSGAMSAMVATATRSRKPCSRS